MVFSSIYLVGLIILTCTNIPPALSGDRDAGLGGLITAMIIIDLGTGGIKSNISIWLAEQIKTDTMYVHTNKKGEKEIVDPNITVQRIFSWFYFTQLWISSIPRNHVIRAQGWFLAGIHLANDSFLLHTSAAHIYVY